MLEARNTTVAPPGRRSTRLTGADGDTSVQPEPNTARRKRQGDTQDGNEGDHSHSVTTHKSQANAQDDDHDVPIRKQVDEHDITTPKHLVNAQDNDRGVPIRKQDDITTRKHQDDAHDYDSDQHGPHKRQDDDRSIPIRKQDDVTTRKHQDDAYDYDSDQRGP